MWPWRRRFLLSVPRIIFKNALFAPIAHRRCEFSNAREREIRLWGVTNIHSGRRSQAAKWLPMPKQLAGPLEREKRCGNRNWRYSRTESPERQGLALSQYLPHVPHSSRNALPVQIV